MNEKILRRIKKILPYDLAIFLVQFLKNPKDIGSITPSSPQLAAAMTSLIDLGKNDSPMRRILEVGAGTGPITEAIVKKLGRNDQLDIIENNKEFSDNLQNKYKDYPNIKVHALSILDWSPDYKYDAIISSLPFNALEAHFVDAVCKHYQNIAKPNGTVSYFEYIALAKIKRVLINDLAKQDFEKTLSITEKFQKDFEIKKEQVLANFPPTYIHHCQFPDK